MLYESCTNIFLFQNFNILTHFLNANFEKLLHGCRVCPKDNQSQCKKLGIFFIFPFFLTDQPFQFCKKSMIPEIKLVWPN